jgi:hypothetical protein
MKTNNQVVLKYGKTEMKLTASDLQLISDALGIINPDSTKAANRAISLSNAFSALSEYQDSL